MLLYLSILVVLSKFVLVGYKHFFPHNCILFAFSQVIIEINEFILVLTTVIILVRYSKHAITFSHKKLSVQTKMAATAK